MNTSRVLVALGVMAGCQGAPSLSATAQESVVVSPTSYDFGPLQIGQTSGSRTISVNPAAGNQADTVTSITASCPDFVITAPGLPYEV